MASFGQSFSVAPPIQAVRGLPCLGSFSVVWCVRHVEGPHWMASYSVVQCIRCLMGQSLYCSAAHAGMWGEGGYGDGSAPSVWLSSNALLPWLLSFPPQAFPTTVSSLTSPWSVSPQSIAALALGLLHNPWTPAPSFCASRGPVSLSKVCTAVARTVWFSFHLDCHRSALSLSVWLRLLPWCGDTTPASVPPSAEGRSSPTNTPVFPLVSSSYRVLHGSIYSFLLVRYSCLL